MSPTTLRGASARGREIVRSDERAPRRFTRAPRAIVQRPHASRRMPGATSPTTAAADSRCRRSPRGRGAELRDVVGVAVVGARDGAARGRVARPAMRRARARRHAAFLLRDVDGVVRARSCRADACGRPRAKPARCSPRAPCRRVGERRRPCSDAPGRASATATGAVTSVATDTPPPTLSAHVEVENEPSPRTMVLSIPFWNVALSKSVHSIPSPSSACAGRRMSRGARVRRDLREAPGWARACTSTSRGESGRRLLSSAAGRARRRHRSGCRAWSGTSSASWSEHCSAAKSACWSASAQVVVCRRSHTICCTRCRCTGEGSRRLESARRRRRRRAARLGVAPICP